VTAPASNAREQVTALQKRMGASIIGQEHIIEGIGVQYYDNVARLEGSPGQQLRFAISLLYPRK
jgi:hypothetical protein